MKDLFVNTQLPVVTSDRILYTPSNFARNSLLYLQEIGSLRVHKPHSTGRSNLSSYLFFTVTDGEGELICEGRTYSLRTGDLCLLTAENGMHTVVRRSCGVYPGYISMV